MGSDSIELPGGDLSRTFKKDFIFSAIFLFLLIVSVPIGIYLATNRTNILPQADVPNKTEIGEINMSLDASKTVGLGKEFKVSVLVRSDIEAANLFSAQINFPTEKFEVIRIISDSSLPDTFSKKWVKKSFSNQDGTVSLIAGVPSVGLKTDGLKTYQLAEIIFKAKSGGKGVIGLNAQSAIYRNFDNINVLLKRTDAEVSVEGSLILTSPNPICIFRPTCLDKPDLIAKNVKFSSPEEELKRKAEVCKVTVPKEGWCPKKESLKITSPAGGEAYRYAQNVPITWIQEGLTTQQLQISLLVNDDLFGNIATASAALGRFDWSPSAHINLSLIKPNNSFKIRLSAKGETEGVGIVAESEGPFEFFNQDSLPRMATASAQLNKEGGDFNRDGRVDLVDLSILLSRYAILDDQTKDLDINQDGFINDLDIWLLSKLIGY